MKEVDRKTSWRAHARQEVAPRVGFVRAGVLVFLMGFTNGCYVYTPIVNAPAQGSTLSFMVTDRGRVALAPKVGANAERLEGVVESESDTAYVLRMRSVTYINGQTNPWTNEQLVVGKQSVTNARERQFSKSRTALVTVAAVGGLVAFIASRGLFGSGSSNDKTGGDTPPPGHQ